MYLVTGASGFLGGHLVHALRTRGERVRALVRTPEKATSLHDDGVDVSIGDVRDPAAMRAAVRDVTVVLHCAAAGGRHPTKEQIYSTNFVGLRNVLDGLRSTGQGRIVFISGLSVLGIRNLTSSSEDMPYRRSGDVEADVKIRAEEMLLEYHSRYGIETVILRPGIVYGPGDDNLSQVLRAVREGGFAYVGSRSNIVPLVHVSDFVELVLLAARNPQATGRVYHVADGTETTIGAIVDYLAELSGAPKPRLVLPYVVPYVGCLLFETLQRLRLRTKPGPIDRAALRFLGTSRLISIRRAQEELGFVPKVFYREGITETLRNKEKRE